MVPLQAIASIVTTAPFNPPPSASRSSSSGIAVISLLLSATASCPSTSRLVVANAETRWSGGSPAPRSWLRREVFPSIATSSGRSGQQARTQSVKQAENSTGSGSSAASASAPSEHRDDGVKIAAENRDADYPTARSPHSHRNPQSSRTPPAATLPTADRPPYAMAADPRSPKNDPAAPSAATSLQIPRPTHPHAPPATARASIQHSLNS